MPPRQPGARRTVGHTLVFRGSTKSWQTRITHPRSRRRSAIAFPIRTQAAIRGGAEPALLPYSPETTEKFFRPVGGQPAYRTTSLASDRETLVFSACEHQSRDDDPATALRSIPLRDMAGASSSSFDRARWDCEVRT